MGKAPAVVIIARSADLERLGWTELTESGTVPDLTKPTSSGI
jgi:hypothetical protein